MKEQIFVRLINKKNIKFEVGNTYYLLGISKNKIYILCHYYGAEWNMILKKENGILNMRRVGLFILYLSIMVLVNNVIN